MSDKGTQESFGECSLCRKPFIKEELIYKTHQSCLETEFNKLCALDGESRDLKREIRSLKKEIKGLKKDVTTIVSMLPPRLKYVYDLAFKLGKDERS